MDKITIPKDAHKLIVKHVKDGTFRSVSLTPWHKGCDTEVSGEGDLKAVGDAFESLYYDELGGELCGYPHTSLNISATIEPEGLVIECYLHNDETCDEWDPSELNEIVHGLLPEKIRKTVAASDLLVDAEVSTSEGKGTLDNLYVCDLGAEGLKDLASQIKKAGREKIADYLASWIEEHIHPPEGFSCKLEEEKLKVLTCESVDFLTVPVDPS